MVITHHLAAFFKAAFVEAFLGAVIPIQSCEVDPFQASASENMVQEQIDGLHPVALVPVIAVADHDTKLGLALNVIDIIINAIADMFSVQSIHTEFEPATNRLGAGSNE